MLELGRWNAVDPMASGRSWLTPYIYCSNMPISRIDPFGLTDYELSGKGKIKKVEGSDTKDGSDHLIKGTAKYNKNGELKGKEGSKYVTVDKGVFDNMDSNDNFQHFKTSSGEQSDKLYGFIANYVDVEYAKADVVTGDGAAESHFFTSYSNREVAIFNSFLAGKKDRDAGFTLVSHTHNHPNTGDPGMVGSYGPSGVPGGDTGDTGVAKSLSKVFSGQSAMPKYYVWRYFVRTEYNENGKVK